MRRSKFKLHVHTSAFSLSLSSEQHFVFAARESVGQVRGQQWGREGPSVEQPSSKYKLTPTHVGGALWEGRRGGRTGGGRTPSRRGPRPGGSAGFPQVFRRFSAGFPQVFRRCSGGPFLMASANVREDFGPPEPGIPRWALYNNTNSGGVGYLNGPSVL